jgi:hypothetical protein
MRRTMNWGAAFCALLMTANAGTAQEEGGVEVTIGGVVASRYVYHMDYFQGRNFNPGPPAVPGAPAETVTGYAYDANAHNRMMMNQVRLHIGADLAEGTSGYVALVIGEDAQANAGTGNNPLGGGNAWDVEEAKITHSFTDQLSVTVGKFITFQGWEVIDPTGNINISRGYLYQNAEALTLLGGYVEFKASDQLTLIGGLVNGWDQVNDNNDTKTILLRGVFDPTEQLNLGLTIMHGPEGQFENEPLTSIDFVGSLKVNEQLSVAFQFNMGDQAGEDANGAKTFPATTTRPDSSWMGFGIWPEFRFEKFSVGVRLEHFIDSDNARIGGAIPAPGLATDEVSYTDIAITPAMQLADNFTVRGEVRFTSASEDVFVDEDGVADGGNMTIGLEALWTF